MHCSIIHGVVDVIDRAELYIEIVLKFESRRIGKTK